jgi:hypothetical protein
VFLSSTLLQQATAASSEQWRVSHELHVYDIIGVSDSLNICYLLCKSLSSFKQLLQPIPFASAPGNHLLLLRNSFLKHSDAATLGGGILTAVMKSASSTSPRFYALNFRATFICVSWVKI